jgi:hypothetical protein
VDAEVKLAEVLAIRRERYVRIGRLFAQLKADKLYRALDHGSLGSLARSFGISLRTLERACALADTLDTHPILEQRGLSIDQVEAIGQVATEETVEAWAFVANYTGVGELVRAVKMATYVPGVVDMYIEAARIAGVATYDPAAPPPICPPGTVPVRSTKTVALAASLRPPPCPRYDRVDADLPEAARWFLANVKPRRQTGIGVIKERQNYTCRNPECARMTLRCHVHHKQYRSNGGSDDASNLEPLCPGCHLRLEHSHRIRITGCGRAHDL